MSELTGLYGMWYRELKVFMREKSRIFSSLLNPLMWLVVFGTGLGSAVSIQGANYQTFIFPGILVMTVLFTCIFFGAYIVLDKRIDFLKEVLVAPISRTTMFFGKALGGTTDAFIEVMILLALGVFFGIHYSVLSVLLTLLTMFIVAISVVSIGLIIGSFMNSTEGFGLIGGFVVFPLFFLSGALFPTNNLPSWLAAFVSVNPLSYAVDLLRGLLLNLHTYNLWLDFSVLVGFAVVMVIAGTLAFRRLKP